MSMSDTTAIAIFAGMMGTVLLLAIGWYIVLAISLWKIFTKAGEPGWKSLIPFYNGYIQYKISWNTQMFWAAFACIIIGTILNGIGGFISVIGGIICFAATIINWVAFHKLSLAFDRGIGFTLGLIFLNPIFILILGFGRDQYRGPQN